MLSFLDRTTRRLAQRGLREGVRKALFEGSSYSLVVGALAWLFRLLVNKERPKIVREEIRLGETIVVTHLPAPPTRRQRRRAERRDDDATGGA